MWGNKKKGNQIDTIIAKGTRVDCSFNIAGNLYRNSLLLLLANKYQMS